MISKKMQKIVVIIIAVTLILSSFAASFVSAENQEKMVHAPINLVRRAINEQGDVINQYKTDEEFTIEYTVEPKNILAEDVVPESQLKDKEIVLVMDISGSMKEMITFNEDNNNSQDEYEWRINENYAVRDIELYLKKNKSAKGIKNYYVKFKESTAGENENTEYALFYSDKSIDEVKEYIKNADYNNINYYSHRNRIRWLNDNANRKYFRGNQKDIEGKNFDKSKEYNIYIATINHYTNHPWPWKEEIAEVKGLAKVKGIIRTEQEESRIDVMKKTVKEFVDKLKDDKRVKISLVSYESYAKDYTYNNKVFAKLTDETHYILYGEMYTQYKDLKYDIDSLQADGGTNIGDGLRKAYYNLKNSGNSDADKYIILMTDGEPTAYSWSEEYENYYIGAGKYGQQYEYYPKNENNYYSGLKYSKKVSRELIANDNMDINSFMIGFSNGSNRNKLEELANIVDGYYKEAIDGNALETLYQQLASQIASDLPVHGIKFEEEFPKEIELLSIESGNTQGNSLKIEGQKISGDIGGISYKLNEETNEYEAEPITFGIKVKVKDIGHYLLNNSNLEYIDINSEKVERRFPILDIKVYETEPPVVNIQLLQKDGKMSGDINEPATIEIKDEKGYSIAIIDKRDIVIDNEGEVIPFSIDIPKDKLIGQSLYIIATDLSGNEVNETISLVYLDNIVLKDYEHIDNTRPGILVFDGEENLSFVNIQVNGKDIENSIYIEKQKYNQNTKVADGKNAIKIAVENQFGNTTTMEFDRIIDAISPEITTKYVDGYAKLSSSFSEQIESLWIEIKVNEEDEEIEKIDIEPNKPQFEYKEDWENKIVTIKAKDLAGNIGVGSLPEKPKTSILDHGLFINSVELQNQNDSIDIVEGYEIKLGVKIMTFDENIDIMLHLNKDGNDLIDNLGHYEVSLYRVNNGELEPLEGVTSEILISNENEGKYNIKLAVGKEGEYIFVYSLELNLADGIDTTTIINSVETVGNSSNLKVNIEKLPEIR